jgi:hypothetical protein
VLALPEHVPFVQLTHDVRALGTAFSVPAPWTVRRGPGTIAFHGGHGAARLVVTGAQPLPTAGRPIDVPGARRARYVAHGRTGEIDALAGGRSYRFVVTTRSADQSLTDRIVDTFRIVRDSPEVAADVAPTTRDAWSQ